MTFDLCSIEAFFHGSPEEVKFPDILVGRLRNDFGRGFYTFPSRKDAYDWAQAKRRQLHSEEAFVNRFDLNDHGRLLTVKLFDRDIEEDLLQWVKFVVFNREYRNIVSSDPLDGEQYDAIVGPTANSNLADEFDLLLTGRVRGKTIDEMLLNFVHNLEIDRLDNQVCFKTKKAERALRYIGVEKC